MANLPTVVVGMSGGVDSSVAVALLKEQGYPVIGMMLRLWSEPGREDSNRCCTPDSMALARRVAAQLGIPFYAVDAQQAFRTLIVEDFLHGYLGGETPNPCILCNRLVRWTVMLERAEALGGTYLATGHYAQIQAAADGKMILKKGLDVSKDQSYVLHQLNQHQLAHTLMPLGGLRKTQVREMARRFGLSVAERPDSQDLCFLAGEDYREFLLRQAPQARKPGSIVSSDGKILGTHDGLAFYTIGQRKGLGLSSPTPLFVLEKRIEDNVLVVGALEKLGQSSLWVADVNWISGNPPEEPVRCQVKIRYKAQLAWAVVTPLNDNAAQVEFDQPLRDITPGQFAVFYQDDCVLGGGIIRRTSQN